ncbi:MAG: aspartate--tRNA ligase [SAR202 cluster bacterium]|nr:aspartate--tRNA ligase [SAR202 cluster bacterium]
MFKTINCGDLRPDHAGRTVTLAGWVHRRRDHGNLVFTDLRDRAGIAQVVFNPEVAPVAHEVAQRLRSEWVVQVVGEVSLRPVGTENKNLPTGGIEVFAKELNVLAEAKTPPFYINEDAQVDELLRMQYRYLDLRRPVMRDYLILRHRIVKFMRDYLNDRGFLEIETPILIKSTPEGARDYVVPSRIYPGKFYALPQSPQQLKQLLMVSGFERYFQIARCFRDEDLRADRQPEFTQLDLEMSFIDREDILQLIEDLYVKLVRDVAPQLKVRTPIPRLSHAEAVDKYGSDKPDIRFEMHLAGLTDILCKTEFRVFQGVIAKGGIVKAIAAPGMGDASRRQADDLVALAKNFGAQGLVTIGVRSSAPSIDALTPEDVQSSAGKGLAIEEVRAIAKTVSANPGDLILIAAGPASTVNTVLGQLRLHLGHTLGLADPNEMAFVFILDFPLVEWNEDEKKFDAVHHPFTSPKDEHWDILETDPGAAQAKAYDLAANGLELAGGSIRIHRRDLQERMFKVLGYSREQAHARFSQLLEAFEYGAPPHGGFAGGIERLTMVLSQTATSIRDVMAFPKTQAGVDPLFGAPDAVEDRHLKELHIKIVAEQS